MTATKRSVRRAAAATPVTTLFLAAGAAAGIVVLANAAALSTQVDAAAVRELELFVNILGRPGWPHSDWTGHFFAWLLPSILNRPFALSQPGSLLLLLALSLAAALVVFWTAAALAVPVIWVAARIFPPNPSHRDGGWFWGKAYPLGLMATFALPAIRGMVRSSLAAASPGARSGLTIVLGVALWFGLQWALRDSKRVRRFVRWSFGATLALAIVSWSGAAVAIARGGQWRSQPAPQGLPNVLLVSIDSLRSDHVHAYGYGRETTPTIDALANDGALFRTVVSPTSWTLPAHLTLLTSLPPEEHGVVNDDARLRKNALFLSEVLWDEGYTTAGFVSGPYLNAAYGFAQGWDHYDDYTVAQVSHLAAWKGTTSQPLLGVVSQWLHGWDAGGRQRPFFIFLHMWDVHYDYTPPPPYDSMFDPDYRGTVTGEDFELGTQVHAGMDPRDLHHVVALYDGEIRYTDLYLGKVLEAIRSLGVLDDTVVVVTADHGDEFFEHGQKGHKKALYDESILVPLVIRFPRQVPAGTVVTPQVRLMDVAPTIISLAGLHKPPGFGTTLAKGDKAPQDLTPWIAGAPMLPPLTAFSDLEGEAPVPIASVRTPNFKLIQELDGRHGEALYDLAKDPGERANLVPPGRVADSPLRQELAGWREALQGRKLSQTVELSEDQKEHLRALGYLK